MARTRMLKDSILRCVLQVMLISTNLDADLWLIGDSAVSRYASHSRELQREEKGRETPFQTQEEGAGKA